MPTIAIAQPPKDPITIYSVGNTTTGTWACSRSNGTVLSAASTNPIKDCSVALRAAAVDLSTLITLYGPSGNSTWTGQLTDMPIV
jgi:hypothetical protein